MYGKKATYTTKQLLSELNRGKNNPFYGRRHTKETKEKNKTKETKRKRKRNPKSYSISAIRAMK